MAQNSILDDYLNCDCNYCDKTSLINYPPNDLNIIHVNICSISKNFDNLLAYLSTFQCSFDVIGVSETQRILNIDNFQIPGFDAFFNESAINKCDGFLFYVKSDLVRDCSIITIGLTKFVRIVLTKNSITTGLIGCYRLPSLDVQNFVSHLENLYSEKLQKRFNIEIFLGDININILETSKTEVTNYMNCLQSFGFHSLVNKPTRVQLGRKSSCLDHFFVRVLDKHLENQSKIMRCGMSDHYPIILNIKLKECQKIINQITYSKLNSKKLNRNLKNENWDHLLQSQEAEYCADYLINTIKKHIDTATEQITSKSKAKKLKPWITQGIINSIRQRDKLKKISAITRQNDDCRKYRAYRDQLSTLIKQTKNRYYTQKFEFYKMDPKKTWKLIRQATNEKEKNQSIVQAVIDDAGRELDNSKEVAESFNTYFRQIGKKMASKIIPPNVKFDVEKNKNNMSMFLRAINENELIIQINSLKNNSAPGWDGITVQILKDNHLCLLQPLLHLVNLIFKSGHFPECFKKAIITPIHKSGDKKMLNNYRPISLTSNLSKLVEKCIKLRLTEFLEKNDLLSKNQYGFKQKTSTEDAVICLTDHVNRSFLENKRCMGIFLDLAKAFDTVTHRILLEKLQNMGIGGNVFQLIRSFLQNRTQSVRINQTLSTFSMVDFGVPQGTVLGPLLFNIYVNELLNLLPRKWGDVICFADDTVIIIKGKTWAEIAPTAENVMKMIKSWLDKNILTLNIKKSNFVCFSVTKRNASPITDITVHEHNCLNHTQCNCNLKIYKTDKAKYLGVVIDPQLRWQEHVEYISGKIRKLIYKFYQLRQIMTIRMLKTIYFALVESILNYCIAAWGATNKTIIEPLKITQKYILKVMLNKKKTYSTENLYVESNVLQINQLYIKSVVRYTLKTKKYLHLIKHNTTRHAKNVSASIPNTRLSKCQKNLLYSTPKIFNMLPLEFKNKPFNKIKKKLQVWLIDKKITWFTA